MDVEGLDELQWFPALFALMGAAAMYYWNSVLNTLYSVIIVRYPKYPSLSDTITSSYASAAFVTAVFLSLSNPLRLGLNLSSGLTLALMAILVPVAVLNLDEHKGCALLHLTAIIAGVAASCFQVSTYAFSVILPKPLGGWVSFGYGACGVLTFAMWMLISEGIFDISADLSTQVAKALWCHMLVATVLIATATIIFQWAFRSPMAQQVLSRAQEKSASVYLLMEESGGQIKLYVRVFRKTWMMQVGMALLMGMSMMAYPLIGPYRWGRSVRENDVLTGTFQVCDFVGRYIPHLCWLLPGLLIPAKLVLVLTLFRVILLALFISIALSTDHGSDGLLQCYSFQFILMVALAITHGWYATVYMTRIPEGVTHPSDKAKASAIGISLVIFMIAVGLWSAKFV
eukprot:Blabericola_migrator_1__10996@NODE_637_length_7124_cov_71_025648_g468_i0_p2_GENE_NODE_637_length_7124_cov_71_025648_g468_i0NODE_637_length_7124_cov_71_025648_g468_i0_p2_ORF_typecomplete_len400_score65_96Nucleoside_tran/PF01733_18/1_7e27_NODE_637_length_7124_cov_71_025648_g468_i058237022